jgi:NAD+ synthetase
MKVGLLQLDATVGAVDANVTAILRAATEARAAGADVAVTSELAVTGYPPRDLLDRPAFVRAVVAAEERLVREAPAGLTLIVGTVRARAADGGRPLVNAAIVIEGGSIVATAEKRLLPTYDVFDEDRYFEPGRATTIVATRAGRLAITICEDAWNDEPARGARYAANPLEDLSAASCDAIVNLSASPFTLEKRTARPERFAAIAARHGAPVVFVNQVGANDELVFDGRSSVYGTSGQIVGRAPAFAEAVLVVDLAAAPGSVAPDLDSEEDAAYQALVAGVRGYARKCGFRSAVLGLSGGIDSALVATIAADALGPDAVLGVAMPSRYSSQGSLDDARALAANLGIRFREQSIEPAFAAYLSSLGPLLDDLAPPLPSDTTLENLQARIRGATLMAISNRTGAIVLTTGNKSELGVGYATLYGDMCGGLAVISDVPKTLVWRLSRFVNRERERIPVSSIEKPPSAELRPDQKDEDSLPAYPVLDRILELHVEEGYDRAQLLAAGLPKDAVERTLSLVRTSEYKRRQAAPGLILTKKAFGVGRRMPVAQAFRE